MRKAMMLFAMLFCSAGPAQANDVDARLLRFPTIHGDRIVFTCAGDLYTVSAKGGLARKLTNHEGFEMFAHFSPDGKWLAFTGQYDGNTEVYLMPSDGGIPKRLTYTATLGRDDVSDRMGPNNIVMGWSNDGKRIIFRTRMITFNDFIGQLFAVSVDGGMPEQVPVPRGGWCSYSPDDKKLAYNRVFREFRTWKRYRGGMCDDISIYDFATKKTERITDTPDQEIFPMWKGDKIYFLSDRDQKKRMNLYVHDLGDKSVKQLTHFTDFDIKFPTLGDKAIVFEYGGYIHRFDLDSGKCETVSIQLRDDFPHARGGLVNVSKKIASYEISPDGKRALFNARGEIFTVPAKHGPTRNLSNTSGVHERGPQWSPDGKWIAYIADGSGEDEVYIVPQDGSAAPTQLTNNADTYKYRLAWSPDSKRILWADKKLRLQYVDVESKKVKQVAEAKTWEITDYSWSPDSKWIAYARPEQESMPKVYLYSMDQDKAFEATDGWYTSSQPVFSPDGKYLFVVSNRDFNPIYSRTEWNHAYLDLARIFVLPLARDTDSPFKPKSDEVSTEDKKEDAEKDKEKDKEDKKDPAKEDKKPKKVEVKIDTEGLKDRLVGIPITPGSYRHVVPVGNAVWYLRQTGNDSKWTLYSYDLKEQKETGHGNVNGYVISANQKKMLVNVDKNYGIIDLPKENVAVKEPLNLSNMEMLLDRAQEWKAIYHESWRQMRDFFYDPNMHGVDWKAVRDRYEPLVSHVRHRADLNYIIGEMIGELNVGHAYIGGGDVPEVPRISMGLLGGQVRRDDATGYYKITKILKGANWDKSLRSPLTEVGVDANEGDFILSINGRTTKDLPNIYEALIGTVGKQVKLRINKEPKEEGSREVVIVPIGDESNLYYFTWVQDNIKKVAEATDGQVGYIHVPDMGVPGLNEFMKHFYPQLRKKALIIDVRGNGGGNVSPMLIERLRRELAMVAMARNTVPTPNPGEMILGPMVCLLNEFSASDGDLFPYRFRKHNLGKLIGKRSWGGVVGIRGSLPIIDGGILNRPEFAKYDTEGKEWIIEGYGVDPDIVVDNDPAKEFSGIDEQLQKAIEHIKEEMKAKGKELPKPPPFPKK